MAAWRDGHLLVWTGTSTPFRARRELADALALPEHRVHVTVPDYGGGFGGKHGSSVAVEAARLARAAGGPVKVQWSRHEEFHWGYLRPAALIDVSGSADASGLAHRLDAPQRQLGRDRDHDPLPGTAPADRVPARRLAAAAGLVPRAGRHRQQLRARVAHGRARARARDRPGRVPAAVTSTTTGSPT